MGNHSSWNRRIWLGEPTRIRRRVFARVGSAWKCGRRTSSTFGDKRDTVPVVTRISDRTKLELHHPFLSFKKLAHCLLEECVCFQIHGFLAARRCCAMTFGGNRMRRSVAMLVHPCAMIVVMFYVSLHDFATQAIPIHV